jgi:hypothetical protein
VSVSSADKLAILELVSRYNRAIDHFDPRGFAETFTADGVLVTAGVERAKGRPNLEQYVGHLARARTPELRHWVSNPLINGAGDTATLKLYVMVFDITQGLTTPYLMGEYDDDLIGENGKWLFKVRRMTPVAGFSLTTRE